MTTRVWNYVDALAYALALSDSDAAEKFTADPMKWHQGIFDIRKKYREHFPELNQIVFDERPGRPPYSPQVEHFLHVQAQARLMSAANPAYAVLEMSPVQKDSVIRLNKDRLSDHKQLLQEIGQQLRAVVRLAE